jgi:hypothetical protein
MTNQTHNGKNGTFEVLPNNALKITLTKEGRKENRLKAHKRKEDGDFLWDMFEDIFCNSSLEFLRPEEIGALTDSVIIGQDIQRDEDGNITKFDGTEKIWWNPNYMVASIHDQLKEHKECILTYAN